MSVYVSLELAKDKHCQVCRDRAICYRGDGYSCQERKAFDLIPAAEVRPVIRGKWQPSLLDGLPYKDEWYRTAYTCSECSNVMLGRSDFCPWCGADMRDDNEQRETD